METLIVSPKTKEQLTAIKAVIKALRIDFKSGKNFHHSALNNPKRERNWHYLGKANLDGQADQINIRDFARDD